MPAIFPNRTCTCGYTRFRESRATTDATVQRWMLFNDGLSGLGATPFGTYFGASSGGTWGLFTGTTKAAAVEVVCERCQRVRSSRSLGGLSVFGVYIENGYLYLAVADLTSIACLSIHITGPSGTYVVPPELVLGSPPPILAPAPATTAETPPAGALLVDRLIRARLPEVDITGTYTAVLVDRCCGCDTALTSFILEAPPMTFSPLDADLLGAPRPWLYGSTGESPSGQPASGSRLSVPFDKCLLVVEYDAQLGTLPAVQGFTHAGAGVPADYQLVSGGALRAQTTVSSYWTRTVAMAVAASRAYAYAVFNPQSTPGASPGDGFEISARYVQVPAGPYNGIRLNNYDRTWYFTRLDGSAQAAGVVFEEPQGWTEIAAGDVASGPEAGWQQGMGFIQTGVFQTVGSGAVEAIVRFGDVAGSGLTGLLRNVVTSFGGRFIRPRFTGFTQVTNPRLRLYLVADANTSVSKTARFKIKYGPGTADPYASPVLTAEATLSFPTANAVLDLPIDLSGLTANAPFWFTIERDWSHGDDGLDATVHLIQCTVRSQ